MSGIEIRIRLLADILLVKQRALSQILNITENQKSILLSGETGDEVNMLFNGLGKEKQALIDEVIMADHAFQNTFDEIGDEFEHYAQIDKSAVGEMQSRIKDVMDIDIKIRDAERRNKEIIAKHQKGKKILLPKASKSYILNQYRRYNSKERLK